MISPIVLKLAKFHALSETAVSEIDALFSRRLVFRRHSEISLDDDDGHRSVWALVDGWACRYVILPDGKRQIVGLMTPGDFSDTRSILLSEQHFATMAMTTATVVSVNFARFKKLLDGHRELVVAFAKSHLVDESIMQMWIANLGRKTALQRMAHLLCEMVTRVSPANNQNRVVMKLPLIQADLADILGISLVHVNRILKSLRAAKLIHFQSKWLEVSDYTALAAVAEFDANYLYYDESLCEAA